MSTWRGPTLAVAPGVTVTAVDLAHPCGEKLKRFSFEALLAVCEERFGPSAYASWVTRHGLDTHVIAQSPYLPVEYCYSFAEMVVNERCGGDPAAAAELGAACAEREINALFRFVLGFTSPSVLLRLSSVLWRKYYDRSELVVVESLGDGVHLELRGWELMNATAAYVHCGAMQRWLQTCRASAHFTVLEFAAPGLLKFSAKW